VAVALAVQPLELVLAVVAVALGLLPLYNLL
jgi:hypothetical protein